jgi:group I intron endonuclease
MIIYSIYKVVNKVNGKIYIGFTSNFNGRKKSHKKSIKNPKYTSIFHNSLRKYGWDSFEWEILYQSKDKEHTMKIMEPFFIEQYNSYNSGYNMTIGGEGNLGFSHDEKTKEIIGSRTRGKSLPTEHKQKISKSHFGIIPSNETRLKMSKNRKGRNWYNNGIKNIQSKTHPGEGWVRGRIICHHTLHE